MARQMIGQRLARGFAFAGRFRGRSGSRNLRRGRLDILQGQFKLLDGAFDLLGGSPEARPLQNGKLRLQFLDQGVAQLQPLGCCQLPGLRAEMARSASISSGRSDASAPWQVCIADLRREPYSTL